ncbi:ThiF family adenylyltransferase [Nostoc sp. UIC 10607]|uniref:ThiF family adenylyltransferase n=1 Tax=Nostoc sp. UIC 10607 TaxID=3045935 RepID=UPI0039A1FBC0
MVWFLNDMARLQQERTAIEELKSTVNWLKGISWKLEGSALCIDADIEAHGYLYPIQMVYPATFPANPPTVKPREQGALWSLHQYGPGGELCLEWGPDTWLPEITGSEVITSVYNLLHTENPKGSATITIAPSRHCATIGQEMRYSTYRFLATPSLLQHLTNLPRETAGAFSAMVLLQTDSITAFVKDMEPEGGDIWADKILPQRLEKHSVVWRGFFLRSQIQTKDLQASGIKALKNAVGKYETFLEDLKKALSQPDDYQILLIEDITGKLHLYRLPGKRGIKFRRFDSVTLENEQPDIRLGPDVYTLSGKKVGVVGLGSVGSKIALSLARSGINHFVLVDGDVFLPGNIHRHILDWRHVGGHKVVGIEDQLMLISPAIKVSYWNLELSGQESTAAVAGALEDLSKCDLIIDATANPAAFNQLSMIAVQSKRGFLWLEVYAGGIGGMVARYRPGKEPTPPLMRAHYHAFTAGIETPPPVTSAPYTTMSRDNEPLIASDADVAVIANHASRMVLDFLSEREPSAFPYPMYLIGLKRGWIFNEPFHTIPIDIAESASPQAPIEPASEIVAENAQFLFGLMEATQHASPPTE